MNYETFKTFIYELGFDCEINKQVYDVFKGVKWNPKVGRKKYGNGKPSNPEKEEQELIGIINSLPRANNNENKGQT